MPGSDWPSRPPWGFNVSETDRLPVFGKKKRKNKKKSFLTTGNMSFIFEGFLSSCEGVRYNFFNFWRQIVGNPNPGAYKAISGRNVKPWAGEVRLVNNQSARRIHVVVLWLYNIQPISTSPSTNAARTYLRRSARSQNIHQASDNKRSQPFDTSSTPNRNFKLKRP